MLEKITLEVDKKKWERHPRVTSISEKGDLVAESEKFTSEQQQRRAFRTNNPFYPRELLYDTKASIDGIKHFVDGIGDTNPLFRD